MEFTTVTAPATSSAVRGRSFNAMYLHPISHHLRRACGYQAPNGFARSWECQVVINLERVEEFEPNEIPAGTCGTAVAPFLWVPVQLRLDADRGSNRLHCTRRIV